MNNEHREQEIRFQYNIRQGYRCLLHQPTTNKKTVLNYKTNTHIWNTAVENGDGEYLCFEANGDAKNETWGKSKGRHLVLPLLPDKIERNEEC